MIFVAILVLILGIFTIIYISNLKTKDDVINDNETKKQNIDKLYSEYISNYIKEKGLEKQTDAISYWYGALQNLVLPRRITFYKKGQKYSFDYGSDEFYKIIELNIKRCTDEFGTCKCHFPLHIEELKKNGNLLEYDYENYQFAYFNLSDDILNNNLERTMGIGTYMGDSEELLYDYYGLSSASEILEYLNSII